MIIIKYYTCIIIKVEQIKFSTVKMGNQSLRNGMIRLGMKMWHFIN